MNQAQLVDALAEQSGQSKTVVAQMLGGLGELATTALAKGDEVVLPHIGKLKSVARKARTARNPRTGATVQVAAKTVVKFSAAKDLRDAMPKPKKSK